ncbi:Cyanamide hydratase [Pleurotus pulmonarius]
MTSGVGHFTQMSDQVEFYGFTPVPRDPEVLFRDHPTANAPATVFQTVENYPFPESPLVREVETFVTRELDQLTINHSKRVYIYGMAIAKLHFPSWSFDPETYYLACLLHDIGTAERFLLKTKLSFEFKGAIVARDLLLQLGSVEDQADSVCDAIVRHQDIFVKGGNITVIGQVLQLATILDNVGLRANLIHPKLMETALAKFSGKGWMEKFATVVETELRAKPWCHTSSFEHPNWREGDASQFAADVRKNDLLHKLAE